ncbi:arylsulfatase [Draconibacterium sp. IB214405]|uniref:arylsulfatase n=1 Tax=Draconibacterium sp. IB214405 TaxID=3097352 RepID=UPI002A12B37B|nr:arylsulfatase [Draconibacterium sp. IB214405]MDX8340696.1 arylsulfatase [Draconibacterium sp. IB214405]
MKTQSIKLICGLLLIALCSCQKSTELSGSKPNIIFILADDMSYYDLSCLGQKEFSTPNIDKLYNNGLFFSEAYSSAPECAPARGTLMEGKHLGHSRIRLNRSVRMQDHLKDEDITVAEMLKTAGYKTGFVGKWGIGLPGTEGTPDKQGFDYAYGFYDQLRAHGFYPHYMMENGKQVPVPENYGFDMDNAYAHTNNKEGLNVYDENGQLLPKGIKDPYKAKNSQDLIHEKALTFLKDNHESPMFLYYATQLPHGPCITPDLGEYKDKPWEMKHKEWAAMMTHLDRHVGELVDLTVELGIDKNTIFIFSSDNGYAHCGYMGRKHWEDDPLFKNKGPWKAGKFASFDGGVRIPMLAYCPGKVQKGNTSHKVVLYDFLATACDMAGVNPPENDGLSFVPLLQGNTEQQEEHAYLYWGGGTFTPQAQAVRMGDWFATRNTPAEPLQLWNLKYDISCEKDVAKENPALVKEILEIMQNEHRDSEWYTNPGDTKQILKEKKEKAEKEGTMQVPVKANSVYPKIN